MSVDMEPEASDRRARNGSPYTVREKSPPMEDTGASIGLISQGMKSMMKKIQDLRHLGVENKGMPLPKVCVVGDQSAGKSSLIEGMSEIKVPRSAGCCTRCPLEINLSESELPDASWMCRVYLMKRYIYDASGKLAKRVTNAKPLGPWIEQDMEEQLFDTATDKEMVPEILKWAQLATLNPGRPYEEFTRGKNAETDAQYTQVKFSPNVVRLDISAPAFPDLSFYDLPGVINVAEVDTEKYLVTLVENLVKQYTKADNCIILLTMPMTDDATNSSAARIVREIPGASARTLGVLTKPDRVQHGEGYEQWREILSGNKFCLGHDYYVVCNNPDPLVTHAQAREEEAMFFSRPPWATELAPYGARFGTRKLQTALSKLLLRQIQDSLPRIVEQIRHRAMLVDEELASLPDPPTANLPYILCQKLNIFTNNLQAHIGGGSPSHPFLKLWSQVASEFQQYLLMSRPALRMCDNIDFPGLAAPTEDDGETNSVGPSPTKRKASINGQGDKRYKASSSPPRNASGESEAKNGVPLRNHFQNFPVPAKIFDFQDIRDINSNTYVSGVPGLGNPQAVETMNRISVSHWKEPMEKFLSVTYTMMCDMLISEVEQVFEQYQQTVLYTEVKEIIQNFLQSIHGEHTKQSNESYEIESSKPFTLAAENFERGQTKSLEYLLRRRRDGRVLRFVELMEHAGKRIEPHKVKDTDLGPDNVTREIGIMAASRAYYDIASSRFVDVTCQGIHTKLFYRCRNELRTVIEDKLGILEANSSERCTELMVEDVGRQRRRSELKKEKAKLDKAQEWLKVAETESESVGIDED